MVNIITVTQNDIYAAMHQVWLLYYAKHMSSILAKKNTLIVADIPLPDHLNDDVNEYDELDASIANADTGKCSDMIECHSTLNVDFNEYRFSYR